MESFVLKYRNVLTLATLIVVQVLGLALQVERSTDTGLKSNLLHIWAIRMIAPIERVFVHSGNSVSNAWHNYVYLRGLRNENDDLHRQLDQMRIQNIRLQEDALQARRIQALLGFKEQFVHKTIAAQVIGTSGSDLSRVIYIDRGLKDGIKRDSAVITPEGIVGKVLSVDNNTATVLEITDQTAGVGALLVKSRLQGIVKGTAGGDVILANIMSDEKVEVGDPVTTSGGDRIFPKGLPIGTVSGVFPGKDVFLNIRLKPAANLNKLEEVLVVTEISTQAPDTQDMGPIRASDILASRLPSVPQSTTPPDANQEKPPANAPSTAPGTASTNPNAPNASKTPAQPTTVKPAPQGSTSDAAKKQGSGAVAQPKQPATNGTTPKKETPKQNPAPTQSTPAPQGPTR